MSSVAPGPLVQITRTFGWSMMALLAAFLLNNYLVMAMGWPGITAFTGDGEGSAMAWASIGVYAVALAAAVVWSATTKGTPLRTDSERISKFNAYLVRSAFWGVMLVGVADATISFVRVEGMLAGLVGEELATQLGRPNFRGPNIHVPLLFAGLAIGAITRGLGFAWLALLIVMAELTIVFTRFVFSYEQAFMGDLVRFWYAALFLFASAHTLLSETHVRVDVFYAGFSNTLKGLVNALGTLLLGMTMCWVILIVGLGSKTAIINSPMVNFEVSQSGFGMYTKYLMAGFLAVFAITMLVEFVGYLMAAVANYRGDPGAQEPDSPPAH